MVQLARERCAGIVHPKQHHTVAQLLAEYLAEVTPCKSMHSQRRDRMVLQRFTTRWGTLRLEAVSSKLIEDYMAERMTTVTLASVSKELGVLKSAFTRAMRWDWIPKSPFRGITLNQEGEERLRWLTEAEEAQLLAACPPWLQDHHQCRRRHRPAAQQSGSSAEELGAAARESADCATAPS